MENKNQDHTSSVDGGLLGSCSPEDLLRSADLLPRIVSAVSSQGVVGEDRNIIGIILVAVSSQLDEPISVSVRGESASGKSTVVKKVLRFFPKSWIKEISYTSEKALFYLKDANLEHKILYFVEADGAQKAEYAIRLLQSEGKLTAIAAQASDGGVQTQEFQVKGPVAVIDTTTRTDWDEQNESRVLELLADESPEQTARVIMAQAVRAAHPTSTHLSEAESCLIGAALAMLNPVDVVIPWAPFVKLPNKPIRMRRDAAKLWALIKAAACLCQYQRERVNEGGKECVVANGDDYELAAFVIEPTLAAVASTINGPEKATFEAAQALPQPFKLGDLTKASGKSESTIRRHLNRLVELGLAEKQWATWRVIPDKMVGSPLPKWDDVESAWRGWASGQSVIDSQAG